MKDGWFNAKIMGYGLSQSKEPGREQYAIGFEIVDGESKGETIVWYGGTDTDAALEYTIKNIRRAGGTGSLDAIEFARPTVRIMVETQEYNGKTRQKVAALAAAGGGVKTMEPAAAKSVAARLADKVKAIDARIGSGAARPAPSPASWGTSGHGANAKHTAPRDDFGGGDDHYTADADDVPFISQADTIRDRLR